jgi:hypothetical protein
VNATGYIINAILVLLVLRQIRESRLDLASLVLPVVVVAGAAAYYLRTIPAAGNDIALDLTLAAVLWIVGVGSRMAFAFFSDHGGGPAIARFSATHHITSGAAWVAALVLMALVEVMARLVTLRARARRLPVAASPVSRIHARAQS